MKSKFVSLTAKFVGTSAVQICVHNTHTGRIYHLLWNYADDDLDVTTSKSKAKVKEEVDND